MGFHYRIVIHHVVFRFVVASGTKNITIMAWVSQMHARRNSRTQILSCIMWLLRWVRTNRWSNVSNWLICSHIGWQRHILECTILIVLRAGTLNIEQRTKLFECVITDKCNKNKCLPDTDSVVNSVNRMPCRRHSCLRPFLAKETDLYPNDVSPLKRLLGLGTNVTVTEIWQNFALITENSCIICTTIKKSESNQIGIIVFFFSVKNCAMYSVKWGFWSVIMSVESMNLISVIFTLPNRSVISINWTALIKIDQW